MVFLDYIIKIFQVNIYWWELIVHQENCSFYLHWCSFFQIIILVFGLFLSVLSSQIKLPGRKFWQWFLISYCYFTKLRTTTVLITKGVLILKWKVFMQSFLCAWVIVGIDSWVKGLYLSLSAYLLICSGVCSCTALHWLCAECAFTNLIKISCIGDLFIFHAYGTHIISMTVLAEQSGANWSEWRFFSQTIIS